MSIRSRVPSRVPFKAPIKGFCSGPFNGSFKGFLTEVLGSIISRSVRRLGLDVRTHTPYFLGSRPLRVYNQGLRGFLLGVLEARKVIPKPLTKTLCRSRLENHLVDAGAERAVQSHLVLHFDVNKTIVMLAPA